MRIKVLGTALCIALSSLAARGETMLQYFNTSWAEITRKMPELAEAGYSSMWLPPPNKASGGLSVGYDLWDRFDLGSKDQRGSARTRYGTEAELLEMVKVAHRFGIRVYFDNIMNHNAFDVPGYNAYTPIDTYPGFVPEDFHLRRTEDGFYRKWDNTRSWSDAWQVQNLGLADLIDIATEPGPTNYNHGSHEGATIPKIKFIRHPDNPEYYCYDASGNYVGFGTDNGLTSAYIQAHPEAYAERVEDMLNRAARWQIDRTKCDGYRLDAVKHTPAEFFGATYGVDKDSSDYGYLGQVQRQFNLTRGYSDANHRDTVFSTENPRDDAMVFGEHLGQPPAYGSYIDAGMRLIDNDLRSTLNGVLGNGYASLAGLQYPGSGGFSDSVAVMHAQSHDNDYAARRELQHAMYFTRAGLGLIYTDGNYQAETLGESGGAFPRHANTSFLGQWGDQRVPNILKIHQDFARGWQKGRVGTSDLITYERMDGADVAGSCTMLVAINDNYDTGVALTGGTTFPSTGGGGAENDPDTGDEYLYQYARGDGYQVGFYTYASGLGSVFVPPGSYFVFAPRTPENSTLWGNAGGSPITIYENGNPVGSVTVTRQDGPDGDPAFNPYGVADANTTDYKYSYTIPRVSSASGLKFVVRADGSAENILLKLDGGIDLNGTRPTGNTDPYYRDNPPALTVDSYLGFEQPNFVHRQWAEKFAAVDTTRNQIGSAGAETYSKVIGTSGFSINDGPASANDYSTDGGTIAAFLYHQPDADVDGWTGGGTTPKQYNESGASITVYAKTNSVGAGFKMYFYYTTDGSYPEGAGGLGMGTTKAVEMNYSYDSSGNDWWSSATVPKPATGLTLRYKIGIYKQGADSVYPSGSASVAQKSKMMTVFQIDGFDAATASYAPNNDYGASATGLEEGFHVLRARPFLKRDGKASLYNTFVQTFYYDAQAPQGEIVYPSTNGETIGGSEYGVVIRADASTSEVWYKITDSDSTNDDANTSADYGNGAWVKATEVTPSESIIPSNADYTREYRFNYVNIPASGTASIQVRFKELSSSANNALSDSAGHFTTVTRTLNTAGPNVRMFVAWPAADGDTINDDYELKVYFTKSLAAGLTEAQLLSRFAVRYAGDDSWPTEVETLGSSALSIAWNETGDYHALKFKLPNLYDGRPEYLWRVEITHDRLDPLVDLTATRRVTFAPSTKPRVTITQPQEFDSDGKQVEIILPDGPGADTLEYTVRVTTDLTATAASLGFTQGAGTLTPVDADPVTSGIQPVVQGSSKIWDFTWTVDSPGYFRFLATATSPTGTSTDTRSATVIKRQLVDVNESDYDDDDDGLADVDEGTITPLPNGFAIDDPRYKANSETWTNGDVHIHNAYGKSEPLMPDTDNDGLPDGLEVGWRTASSDTNTSTDTNGDGSPNFIADLDPPFYNTLDNFGSVPGANSASEGGDRAKQLMGSTTDPGNPDSDGDGILDGVEDANKNGWVDGDGQSIAPASAPSLSRSWPNGIMDAGETWTESDPSNADTDGDGLSDGYGEDKNTNGLIDGDANSDRVWQSGEVWAETNPLKADTDGDGLPDGFERQYGLNPLDDGTTAMDGGTSNPNNGASGDPDGDGFTNLQELLAGTDPRADNSVVLTPGEAIIIGPVGNDDAIIRGAVANRQEFTDWTINDLVVLDEYNGDGTNNQGTDIYAAGDGYDSSRDIVAFYARDGGDTSVGGTGDFYFRVDFQDLAAYAEEGSMDVYVVIDTGNPAVGEYALPNDVDTGTNMKWETVVRVDKNNTGGVYVDTAPGNNTTSINQDLASKGVAVRDQNTANGFKKAYFDSRFDACEFSISRQALLDAGWLGDPSTLNFQVFTVKEGTFNSPVGAGDIGGRTDIRDTIYDDWLASSYWRDQTYIGANGILSNYFNYNGPDRGKRAKVMMLAHGNEPILTGSEIQDRINDNAGTGYYRPLDAHDAYSAKLGLHITPTLATALQWAAVDPAANTPWRDGPAFNQRIGTLAASGTVELMASTFADSPMSYYSQSMLADNVALSNRTLTEIYGTSPSSKVFWIPERIIDEDVLSKVSSLGYTHAFVDQFRHIFELYGRQSALLDDGYRINQINGVKCFVINDQASNFRFSNTDNGLNVNLRELLSRKARSGEQHQILVLYSDLSDFRDAGQADAYDNDIAWLASRPWIELIGPDQSANGELDLSVPPDSTTEQFSAVNRATTSFVNKISPLWLDHASEKDYDFWWFGSALEESLRDKVFDRMPGVPISPTGDAFYGVQSFAGSGSGIAQAAWSSVSSLPDSPLGRLGKGTYHASTFLAGWHNEDNNDLSLYSTGDFIYPDTTYDTLASFATQAQAQSRFAAIYQNVAAWAAAPPSMTVAATQDVDLDGSNEFILKNNRVYAVFESTGARCTAAWVIEAATGDVVQVIGNHLSAAGLETEEEGASSLLAGNINARRTSAFKDWWITDGANGTNTYVNHAYGGSPTAAGDGFTFLSYGSAVTKTITLAPSSTTLNAHYTLGGSYNKAYIRFGLSPDLDALLTQGQSGLSLASDSSSVTLSNTSAARTASASLGLVSNVTWNISATDDPSSEFDTLSMRNQAQTHQVELESTGTSFSIALTLDSTSLLNPDSDGDGMPNAWESDNGLDPHDATGINGASGDPDGDGQSNLAEYIAGTDPQDAASVLRITSISKTGSDITVVSTSVSGKTYRLQTSTTLQPSSWSTLQTQTATGPTISFIHANGYDTARRFYRVCVDSTP